MWIKVEDAPKPFWLDTDECRLANGELAFAYKNLQKPAIPDWFAALPASRLRGSSEELWAWYNMHEHRSMRGGVREVIAFYEESISRGGLAKEDYTRPRSGAGFSADNRKRTFFNLDLYQQGGVVFWTAEFGVQVCEPKKQPLSLLFDGAEEHRLLLRHPETLDEYWVPAASVRDSRPHPEARQEFVLWSSLPTWLHFDFVNGQKGSAVHVRREDGSEDTQITIVTPLGNGDSRFESYLNSLDHHGFDPSGTLRPAHSYYVSLACDGRYRYAHISSDSGEKGLIGMHNNSYDPSLFVRYYPPPKEP